MDFDVNSMVYTAATWVLPVLFAITLHEVAHGWVANKLGDSTAKMLGRLSLNPLKHVDPIGTVLVPTVLLVLGSSFLFGWGKACSGEFSQSEKLPQRHDFSRRCRTIGEPCHGGILDDFAGGICARCERRQCGKWFYAHESERCVV